MTTKVVSLVIALVLFVGVGALSAHAQTSATGSGSTYTTTSTGSSTTAGSSSSTSPGLPNTGAGGDAAKNLMVLTSSVVAAMAGAGYLMMRRLAVR